MKPRYYFHQDSMSVTALGSRPKENKERDETPEIRRREIRGGGWVEREVARRRLPPAPHTARAQFSYHLM
jgi:hypothetical protein